MRCAANRLRRLANVARTADVAQRYELECAFVLAKLLNRTLVVMPLGPHSLLIRRKTTEMTHNYLGRKDLVPLDRVLDTNSMHMAVPVILWNDTQRAFLRQFAPRDVQRVCHYSLIGYWIDRIPAADSPEAGMLTAGWRSGGSPWTPTVRRRCRSRCPRECGAAYMARKLPIVRDVTAEFGQASQRLLYFGRPSLFIDLRFHSVPAARAYQTLIMQRIRYHPRLQELARTFERAYLSGGSYGALHIRRGDHMGRKSVDYYLCHMHAYWKPLRADRAVWIQQLSDALRETSQQRRRQVVVRTATDLARAVTGRNMTLFVMMDWYDPAYLRNFTRHGFRLVTAHEHMDFFQALLSTYPEPARQDILAMIEQLIATHATYFVGTPGSTLSASIGRWRGGVDADLGWRVLSLADRAVPRRRPPDLCLSILTGTKG